MTNKPIINSNHHALYIQILAVSVEYQLSIKVPRAIAEGKAINNNDIKRVEARYFQKISFIDLASTFSAKIKVREGIIDEKRIKFYDNNRRKNN